MTNALYNVYKVAAAKGLIAPLTDTIKVALLTTAYTPDIVNHKNFSDVNADEAAGTGYPAGGNTLAAVAITEDDVGNRALIDANDVSWTGSVIPNARYAVIYKSTGNNATSTLIGYIDFGAQQATNGTTFLITWSASGVYFLG